MKNRSKGSLLGALLLAATCGAVSSCNLLVVASGDACETDEDCINLPNTACDTEQGSCVSLDKCQSNSECGGAEICRPFSPRTCVPLFQGNCTSVYPDDNTWKNDNAMLIGITAPLLPGSPDEATGVSIVNGAKLAADQFNNNNGIEGKRPIVLLMCDDQGDRGPAEENGRTLAAIGVQSIIGPAFSGQTIDTADGTPDPETQADRPGTVDNNTLIISTSATSPLVTGINDRNPKCLESCGNDTTCQEKECPGLVWRTSPSDEIQGKALSAYFASMETKIKTRGGVVAPGRPSLKVFVLYKDDPYGDLLSEVIRTTLQFNGQAATLQQNVSFFRQVYKDADPVAEGNQPDPAAIQTALDEKPDAIFLIGTGEVGGILEDIESRWITEGNTEEDRPFYFLADGGLSSQTSMAATGALERVRGTVPGTQSANFNAFIGDYNSTFTSSSSGAGPTVFGAAGAYDAVYLLAYSSVAAQGKPLTAPQLARGFSSLVLGEPVNVGSSGIGAAYSALQQGGTIDFVGASGDLNFALDSGEAPSEIQVWCVSAPTEAGEFSGLYYDGSKIVGTPDPGDVGWSCPF
ncbi:MAG: ABC transporter substrate-binding protein [Polyangiaceae bacterium]|nr:ABC transporter substrate-binding protein [Polyangiaceae bacterium]